MTIEAQFKIDRGGFALDVDIRIPGRGVTAVFGPSGCGKTTLLRAIAGLDRHDGAFLKVGDTVWQDAAHFIPTHQRPIGYVFQEASLFPHLTVRRNIEYGIKRVAKKVSGLFSDNAIELLDISGLLDRKPDTLSGGEQQRVAIARALSVNPELLLMDEPLAALDFNRKQEILPYLESLHRRLDMPVIYVSHSIDEVARLADHLVLLDGGKVAGAGNPHDILTCLDLPLALGVDAESIIEATVIGHDDEYGLTYLGCPAGRFTVTRKPLAVGCDVRLRVAARDVSLTLEHQSNTSILNIFPATVDEIKNEAAAQVTIRLLLAGVPLLASVTRKSAVMLDLKPGKLVYAQTKSVALLS